VLIALELSLFLATILWASRRATKENILLRQLEEKIRAHQEIETVAVGSLEVFKNLFSQMEDRFNTPGDKKAMRDFSNQIDDIVVNLNSAISKYQSGFFWTQQNKFDKICTDQFIVEAETDETAETGVIADVKPNLNEPVINEAGSMADASSEVVVTQTPSKHKHKKHRKV